MRADRMAAAIGAVLIALCIPLFIANIPRTIDAVELAVADKAAPIMDAAADAVPEPEPEEEEYVETYVYDAPAWYESDDEAANMDAKEWIAQRESGGDYDARNGQYVGKFQLQQDMLGDDLSPEHQEERADEYVAERYGSWQAAQEHWQEHGWY